MATADGSTVNLKAKFNLNFAHKKSVEGSMVEANPIFDADFVQATGTAVNQQDQLWYDVGRTLAAGVGESIDLAGSLSTAFGDTITFTKLKGIYIRNTNTTAADILTVGNVTNHVPIFSAATDSIDIGPGGIFFWNNPSAAGVTVTAGTGDLLRLVEAGGVRTCTFDIAIWGVGT